MARASLCQYFDWLENTKPANRFDKNTSAIQLASSISLSDIFVQIQHSSQTSFPKSLQVKLIAKSKPHLTSVFPA